MREIIDYFSKNAWRITCVSLLLLIAVFLGAQLQIGHANTAPNGDPVVINKPYNEAPSVIPSGARIDCYPDCPTIEWGDYTFWIYGEVNSNQYYFVSAYNSANELIGYKTYSGDRYITSASVDPIQKTISLNGQVGRITFPWDELIPVILFELEVDANPIFIGDPVLATAKFSGTGDASINAVDFYVGNTKQNASPIPLVNGEASYPLSGLPIGTHTLTAHLLKNSNNTVSISNSIPLEIRERVVTVSYESNGGSAVPEASITIGSRIIPPPPPPTREGYTFRGWYKDAQFADLWDFAVDTVPAGNITLYGKWEVDEYVVSFQVDGRLFTTIAEDYGTQITPPAAPTKTGHTFSGWYKDAQFGETWDFAADTIPAGDVTLYGKWEVDEYVISFQVDGRLFTTIAADYGTQITPPTVPTKTGHTFSGWYKNAQFGETWDFAVDMVPAGNITLYGKWETQAPPGGNYYPIYIPSNHAALEELWISAGSLNPAFSGNITAYTVTVANEVESITIKPTLAHWLATMTINEEAVPKEGMVIELDEGKNPITIVTKAENGRIITYSIDVVRETKAPEAKCEQEIPHFIDLTDPEVSAIIEEMACAGIINGYTGGTFKPDHTITRAEFSVILARALKWEENTPSKLAFTDNLMIGEWAKAAIASAAHRGIFVGYEDGSFRPGNQVTRSEMAVIITRALGLSLEDGHVQKIPFSDSSDIQAWAIDAVEAIHRHGLWSDDEAPFKPNALLTRAEATIIISKALKLK